MKFGLDDDLYVGDEKKLDEEQINRLHCFRPRIFGRIIADEAQKLKPPATFTHRSVYDLQAPYHVILTTTPNDESTDRSHWPAHTILAGLIGHPRPGEALLRGLYQAGLPIVRPIWTDY